MIRDFIEDCRRHSLRVAWWNLRHRTTVAAPSIQKTVGQRDAHFRRVLKHGKARMSDPDMLRQFPHVFSRHELQRFEGRGKPVYIWRDGHSYRYDPDGSLHVQVHHWDARPRLDGWRRVR